MDVKALAIQADSADAEVMVAAVERVVQELGDIDILVNNVGIAVIAPMDDYRLEVLDRTLAVKGPGVFVRFCTESDKLLHCKGGNDHETRDKMGNGTG